MKTILTYWYELRVKYLEIKYALKKDYETHKKNCAIEYEIELTKNWKKRYD